MSFEEIWTHLANERITGWLRGGLILIVGFLVARVAAAAARRVLEARSSAQTALVGRRLVFYGVFFLAATMALQHFGFDLSILLGAAGILTVALGFASQTSASNLISGLFLLGERPFQIGDVIRVGTTVGNVLSIDLLSVKLRTFDNLLVRIPNETLLKTEITNLTRFPIRRLDLVIPIPVDADLGRVREVLLEVSESLPICLREPAPLLILNGWQEGAVQLQLSVWARTENFLPLRNGIQTAVQEGLAAAGLSIAAAPRTLRTGSPDAAFPVRLVTDRTTTGGGAVETTGGPPEESGSA